MAKFTQLKVDESDTKDRIIAFKKGGVGDREVGSISSTSSH